MYIIHMISGKEDKEMAIACFGCGKEIKGERIVQQPTNLSKLVGDFDKSYHPSCYKKSEEAAAKELGVR